MKKTIIILTTLLILSKISNAQNIPSQGSYTTNNTMAAFHGTWLWANGIDTVKIYLTTQRVNFDINGGFSIDCIVGWHLYKKGNQTIESSYAYINTPFSNGISTILGGNDNGNNILDCQLKDLSKNKDIEATLTLNTAQNQLTWKSFDSPGLHLDPYFRLGITLPTRMILIKQ